MKRTNAVTKCKKHNDRKLSLFCKTVDCQRAICELCLIKEHISHKVVDIAEEEKKKKEAVKAIANQITSELAVARGNLLQAKNRLEEDSSTTLAILKERKKETIKLYNNMIKSVTDQRNTCNQEVEKEVSSIDSEVKLINDITEGWTRNKTSTSLPPDELGEIQQIKKRVHGYLSKGKTFQYYTHNKEEYTPENSEMRLKRKEIVVSLSDARISNSRHRSCEVRPIGTESFSSSSNDKSDEVGPIGTGSTNSGSSNQIGEVRLTGTGSASSCRKRDGERLHRTGTTSLSSSDKRDDVRFTGKRSFSSTWNGLLDLHCDAFRLKATRSSISNNDDSDEEFVLDHRRKSASRFNERSNDDTIGLKRTSADSSSDTDNIIVFNAVCKAAAIVLEQIGDSCSSDDKLCDMLLHPVESVLSELKLSQASSSNGRPAKKICTEKGIIRKGT